jgi:RNA polymerase sigma-B factor
MPVIELAPERSAVRRDRRPSVQERAARERLLLLRYHRDGDRAAREEAIELLTPLARWLARRYHNDSTPLDDLVQVAMVGVIKAVDGFDPDRGLAFASYAVPTISGELKRYLRDQSWALHVPRGLKERCLKTGRAIRTLSSRLGREPTVDELATELDADHDDVLAALAARSAASVTSLDTHRFGGEDGDRTYADAVGSEDAGFDFDFAPAVRSVVRSLPARERVILHLRFVEDLTLAEIARHVGISQMHVSRLVRRSLTRLEAAAGPRAA